MRLLISVTRRPLPSEAWSLRGLVVTIVLMTCLCAPARAASDLAQQQSAAVSQVIVNILSYTRWPTPKERLRVCIVAPTEFADDLLSVPRDVGNRPLTAFRRAADDPDLGHACDVVYIGVIDSFVRVKLAAAIAGHPVLTISEQNAECEAGATFCLDIQAERVSFKVNLDALARSGVKIHPAVLQLSRGNGASR